MKVPAASSSTTVVITATPTFEIGLTPDPTPTQNPNYDDDGGYGGSVAISTGIKAGETVTLSLSNGDSALDEVFVTVNEDVSSILVTAEKTSLPTGVEATGKNIYQYIDITLYKVTDASIELANLVFDVPRSWLDQNSYGIGDIVMKRYHNGTWQQLPTAFVKEEQGKVYYRAMSPGLSYFAIAYVEGMPVVAEQTPVNVVPTEVAPEHVIASNDAVSDDLTEVKIEVKTEVETETKPENQTGFFEGIIGFFKGLFGMQ